MAMTASDIDKGQHATRLKNIEMALEALYNVLHSNPGVEIQCMGHFKLLFSLLGVLGANKVQMCALQVWNEGMRNECVCLYFILCVCFRLYQQSLVIRAVFLILVTLMYCSI